MYNNSVLNKRDETKSCREFVMRGQLSYRAENIEKSFFYRKLESNLLSIYYVLRNLSEYLNIKSYIYLTIQFKRLNL